MSKKPVIPVPEMNVAVPAPGHLTSITDQDLQSIYSEILDDLRSDRREIDILLNNFVEMVMNEGDGSSSSKEAVVNLVKIKNDVADKKAKIADLMTSLVIKEKNINKLTANQTNHIHITDKRAILESLKKAKKVENDKQLGDNK
jgi:DNA-binding Xre family transcriptional regulator